MSQHSALASDPRPIKAIWFHGGEGGFIVGTESVEAIEAYDEVGAYGWEPWVAVNRAGGEIIYRTAARHVGIEYQVGGA